MDSPACGFNRAGKQVNFIKIVISLLLFEFHNQLFTLKHENISTGYLDSLALAINDQLLYMIKWFLTVTIIFSFISINAQNCSVIDGKKDKKTNITTYSGI